MRHATRRKAIHKVAHRAKPKSRMGALAKVGAYLASPIPDVELLVGSMANPSSGVRFVLGITKRAGRRVSEVQSVIFDRLKWTADAAKIWLRDHGFTTPKVDEGATFWRFRQQDPKRYKEFRTVVPGTHHNPYQGKIEVTNGTETVVLYVRGDGRHAFSSDGEAFEYDGSVWRDMADAEWTKVQGHRNPGPWSKVYKTMAAAKSAWYDSMPGRNDRAIYIKVRGGYRVVPEGRFGGRGHLDTTVDDMERGDSGFVENPQDSTYRVRFIRPDQAGELINLYHTARTALSGQASGRYERMLYASRWFHKEHPEVSETAAYKDLDGLLSNWFGARNPATVKQLYVVQHLAEVDGESYAGKYPASSTTMANGFSRMIRDHRPELLDETGKLTAKDCESYKQVYYQTFRQADYRSHKGMMAKSSLRTPGAGASSNPDYAGQWTNHEEAKPPFYVQVKDKGRWRPMYGGEGIYPSAREASRAMVAHAGEYGGKFAWRALDGDGRIFDELKARPERNPAGNPTHTITGPRGTMVRIWEQDGTFISTFWVNGGETITGLRATHSTLAGARKWAEKVIREHVGRGGYGNPTPGEAISAYDEHLATTLDPAFAAATPDEQAAAMTVQDALENPMPLRDQLVHVVTEYDRKQEGKRGYNRYAIGHYLGAVDRVMEEVGKGYSVRSAITNNFTGRLADYLLRVVGESAMTREEQVGPMTREERNPGDVHLRVYSTEEGANRNREKLKSLGFHTWVERAKRGGGYVWYLMVNQRHYAEALGFFDGHEVQSTKQNPDLSIAAASGDLGQAAFDAGKDFRLSGAYHETGVANARVAKYGFTKWWNNLPPRTKGKAKLLKNWMEGWAAGKRVEKKQGNPSGETNDHYAFDLARELASVADVTPKAVLSRLGTFDAPSFVDRLRRVVEALPSDAGGHRATAANALSQTTATIKPYYIAEALVHAAVAGHEGPWKSRSAWAKATLSLVSKLAHGARGNPESPAAALYEDFHGRPSAETLEIVTEKHEHEWLTSLGTLVELKVATVTQLDATISFARDKNAPELCSSEDGRQLYIEGGNQEVPLKSLKMDGPKFEKDSMVLGILTEVTYHTSKGFHKFRPTDYYHRLGEESGLQPTLLYDPRNKLLSISGGAYRVEDIGIVD